MILALYVIGSAIALIVLAVKLRDTREALRQMIRERNTYAQLVEAWAFQLVEAWAFQPADTGRRPAE